MNRKRIIIIASALVLALVLALAFVFLNQKNTDKQNGSGNTSLKSKEEISQDPRLVISAFMDSVIKSAPPNGDFSEVRVATSYLSPAARAFIPFDPDIATSGDLVRMLKVDDVPDAGYDLGEPEIKDTQARVRITLKYSQTQFIRFFNLSYVDEKWMIDFVSSQ